MVRTTQGYLRRVVEFIREKLHRDSEDASFYILLIVMLVVFVFGMNSFLDLAEALQNQTLAPYDSAIQDYIISFRDPSLTPTVTFITDLGDRWAYFVVIGIMLGLLLWYRRWWLSGQVLFVSSLSALATIVLKNTYERERPGIEHLVEIGGMSFPSGHSLSAMAFYSFVIYLLFRFVRSKALKWSLSIICFLLIISIGLSRIYLGVHYPSDVAAGFAAGLIWASFCVILFNVIELWQKRKKHKQLQKASMKDEDI